MEIIRSNSTKIVDVDFNSIKFGEIFTDHMFECNFVNGDWETPEIRPYKSIEMDPSSHVFHYGQAIFEGMKGYKDKQDQLWILPNTFYIHRHMQFYFTCPFNVALTI